MGLSGKKLVKNLLLAVRDPDETILAGRKLQWRVNESYWGTITLLRNPGGPKDIAALSCRLGVFHEPVNRLYCRIYDRRFSYDGILFNSNVYMPDKYGFEPLYFDSEEPDSDDIRSLSSFKSSVAKEVVRNLCDTEKILKGLVTRAPMGGGADVLAICFLLLEGRYSECDELVRASNDWPIYQKITNDLAERYEVAKIAVKEYSTP